MLCPGIIGCTDPYLSGPDGANRSTCPGLCSVTALPCRAHRTSFHSWIPLVCLSTSLQPANWPSNTYSHAAFVQSPALLSLLLL